MKSAQVKLAVLLLSFGFVAFLPGSPSFKLHTKRHFHRRIVGGEVVAPGSLPFQVSLRWRGDHFCGGSIITPNTIVTAAHCLYGYENDPYEIVAGEHSLSLDDGTEQRRDASRLVLHSGYNDRTFENDIALMWVDTPFVYGSAVAPIALPTRLHGATGEAPVSGWGSTEESGGLSDLLRIVTLNIISDTQCRSEIPGSPNQIKDSMICAYYAPGGKDSCQGDSGGPLTNNNTGEVYLAGIVSWGYGCARAGVPGVYTEVSHFTDWISAQLLNYE